MEWVLGLIIAALCGAIYSLCSNIEVLTERLSELEGDVQVYEHVLSDYGIEITAGLSTHQHNKE